MCHTDNSLVAGAGDTDPGLTECWLVGSSPRYRLQCRHTDGMQAGSTNQTRNMTGYDEGYYYFLLALVSTASTG